MSLAPCHSHPRVCLFSQSSIHVIPFITPQHGGSTCATWSSHTRVLPCYCRHACMGPSGPQRASQPHKVSPGHPRTHSQGYPIIEAAIHRQPERRPGIPRESATQPAAESFGDARQGKGSDSCHHFGHLQSSLDHVARAHAPTLRINGELSSSH